MNFSIKPVTITPKYAEELLKMNTNNRRVRQQKVDSLADSMRKGEWELSNDAITISEGNVLLNGQHRLLAVIQSGCTCPFILFTGAPDSSFDIMDTPTVRSVADVIQRKGGTNTTRASAVVSKVVNWDVDFENRWDTVYRFDRKSKATRKELIEYYENHRQQVDMWLAHAESVIKKGTPLVQITTLAAFGVFLNVTMRHSEEKIVAFFKELIIDGVTKNSTILYARKRLMRHKMKTEVLPSNDDVRYMVRSWNDYVLGRQSQIIKANEDGFRYIKPV